MHGILFFSVLSFGFGLARNVCPEFIICETSEKHDSCPEGTFYREKIKIHNCCPGCVLLKDFSAENQPCDISEDCQPGLRCNNDKKCERDLLQACEYYKRYNDMWKETKYWNPNCLPDGSYAPKQCKGEKMSGKCFCVSKEGRRIFGEADWSAEENMTCACSRKVEDLKRIDSDVTLHCDHLGNFEPLQCDKKVCWCANLYTGIPYTAMVPLEMINSLSCYSRNNVGAQYYRQCDSVNHTQEVTRSILSNHGTTGIILSSPFCNFDGSYYRVQAVREMKRCVYINNSPLTETFKSDGANCNCAFDKHVAKLHQIDFLRDCLFNGSYSSRQILDENKFCVDEDGFYFSNNMSYCPSI